MNIILIVGIIESLFFLLIVLAKKKKTNSDKLLAAILLSIALHLVFPLLIYTDFSKFASLYGIDIGFLVIHAILFYLYAKFLLFDSKTIKINYLIHVIATITICICTIPLILLDTEAKIQLHYGTPKVSPIIWLTFFITNGIYICYLVVISRLVFKYQKQSKNEFSYTEKINLNWLKYLTISLVSIYSLYYLLGLILYLKGYAILNIEYLSYFLLVLFVFILGFFGVKQKNVFVNYPVNERDGVKTKIEITDQDKLFAQRIQDYMIIQKPYLNEKLTLYQLSKSLNARPQYISFILNNVINKKFYDFVNCYRIEEVKKRISNGELASFTIISIAMDSGFNSKASFNRVFKSLTGFTPSQYISKNLEK